MVSSSMMNIEELMGLMSTRIFSIRTALIMAIWNLSIQSSDIF